MKGARGIIVTFAAVFLLLAGTARAGWVIQAEYSGKGTDTSKEVSYFQKEKIRTDQDGNASIMDFSARRIIWIDKKQRKFSTMTIDEFKQAMRESMRQANAAMEEMKKAGIKIPGQRTESRGKITVSKGPGATVAGYACDGYKVSFGGRLAEEIWVTRKIDLSSEMGRKMMKEFEDLNREFNKMGEAFKSEKNDPEYVKIMESGYPMRIVDRETGRVQEVTSAERKDIPADTFGEPKGYAKVPFKDLFGLPTETGGTEKPAKQKRAKTSTPPAEKMDAPSMDAETPDAAKQEAAQPVEEKNSQGLDAIKESVGGGIKKLFKW